MKKLLCILSLMTVLGCQPSNRLTVTVLAGDSGSLRHRFSVEIADDSQERALGLMYRQKLGKDKGMLFLFPTLVNGPFWMKNTLIPLDILFIGEDRKIVTIVEMAVPQTETPRQSQGPYRYVLEIEGGRAKELGIQTGDRVEF